MIVLPATMIVAVPVTETNAMTAAWIALQTGSTATVTVSKTARSAAIAASTILPTVFPAIGPDLMKRRTVVSASNNNGNGCDDCRSWPCLLLSAQLSSRIALGFRPQALLFPGLEAARQ